jgi:CubicO group peptidase (beta-lactamase class C family)
MPLNMHNSGHDNNNALIKNRAYGYKIIDNKISNSSYINMSFPCGAGALYSSIEDLYHWDQALFGNSIFKKEILSSMFTPYIKIDGQKSYGYGFRINNLNGRNVFEHSGGIEGFSTNFRRYVDDKVSIIMLGNIEGLDRETISTNLAAIVFNEEYKLPKNRVAIDIEPKIYDQYVGKYKRNDGFVISIIKENNRLFVKPDGQKNHQIFPESETEFFDKLIDVQIIFIKNKSEKVDKLIFRNKKDTIYEKLIF